MTPKEFLDEFGTLAESAEGVPKLRELILELAVRGKLVHPVELSGSASDLHDSIKESRFQLWIDAAKNDAKTKGKSFDEPTVRSKYALSPRAEHPEPVELPSHWEWTTLETITHPVRTIRYGILKPGPDIKDGIRYVKVRNMKNGVIDVDSLQRTTPEIFAKYAKAALGKGDLLLSIRGSYGGIAKVPDEIDGANITQDSARIAVLPGIDRDFLVYVIRSPFTQGYINSIAKGAAVKGINIRDIRPAPIPLPPLAEQHRIVSKVDELMGLCDRLEAVQGERRGVRVRLNRSSLDRLTSVSGVDRAGRSGLSAAWQRVCDHFEVLYDTPETLPDLRQTILQLAVQGKLVPQNPNDEPADVQQECEADEVLDLPPVPRSWRYVRLKHLSHRVSVGHVGPTSQHYCNKDEGGIPFLRSQNVRPWQISFDGLRYITPEFHDSLKKSQLSAGDLLFVRVGANRGDCCTVPAGLGDLNCANIVFARVKEPSDYIELYCQSPQARTLLMGMTTGSAQGVINTKSVAELRIPLPGLSEQKRIVSKVTHLLSQVTRLESTLTRRESTRTQLLTAAIHALLDQTAGGGCGTTAMSKKRGGEDRYPATTEGAIELIEWVCDEVRERADWKRNRTYPKEVYPNLLERTVESVWWTEARHRTTAFPDELADDRDRLIHVLDNDLTVENVSAIATLLTPLVAQVRESWEELKRQRLSSLPIDEKPVVDAPTEESTEGESSEQQDPAPVMPSQEFWEQTSLSQQAMVRYLLEHGPTVSTRILEQLPGAFRDQCPRNETVVRALSRLRNRLYETANGWDLVWTSPLDRKDSTVRLTEPRQI